MITYANSLSKVNLWEKIPSVPTLTAVLVGSLSLQTVWLREELSGPEAGQEQFLRGNQFLLHVARFVMGAFACYQRRFYLAKHIVFL